MLCRKGWKAVFVFAVAAGLLLRAEAELYPDFGTASSSNAEANLTFHAPEFALINYHTIPHYLGSNSLPDLLTDLPPQDLFTHRFSDRNDPGPRPDLNDPAWENLWHGASRIPINAVPEPSTLALLAIAALLRGARNVQGQK